MVIIKGIVAQRVLNPIITRIAQATSAKIASPKLISGPSPKGSANFKLLTLPTV